MTANSKAKLIVLLNTLTLVGAAITVILLFRIIGNAARLNTSTNEKIAASQKVTENELRCLAAFFSQSNRQALRINNLETCEILNTDTGKTDNLPLSPTSTSPAVPSSDTKQNSTTTETSTQLNSSQNQEDTSQTPAPSQTTPQVQAQANGDGSSESTVTTPPPKEILGIPLCIPFTSRCMR